MQMTFQEVLENESKHPGLKYYRVDCPVNWYIYFDKDDFGKLTQALFDPRENLGEIKIYHHDLYDGKWKVYDEQ